MTDKNLYLGYKLSNKISHKFENKDLFGCFNIFNSLNTLLPIYIENKVSLFIHPH